MTTTTEPRTLSGYAAAEAAGVSYRQLRYWVLARVARPALVGCGQRCHDDGWSAVDVERLRLLGNYARSVGSPMEMLPVLRQLWDVALDCGYAIVRAGEVVAVVGEAELWAAVQQGPCTLVRLAGEASVLRGES